MPIVHPDGFIQGIPETESVGRRGTDMVLLRAAMGLPVSAKERAWVEAMYRKAVRCGRLKLPPSGPRLVTSKAATDDTPEQLSLRLVSVVRP